MNSELQVILSSKKTGRTFSLQYQIRNTPTAQLWMECLKKSMAFGLLESRRFDHFHAFEPQELEKETVHLKQLILDLSQRHPEIPFPILDECRLQESVNELHFHFAHSHHVEKRIGPDNQKTWEEFNLSLHRLEGILSRQKTYELSGGLPPAQIIFTWKKPFQTPLFEESFKEFTIQKEFGGVYVNYPQVGRHLYEMFLTRDDHLADEHIQPQRCVSADTFLWFGPSGGHFAAHHIQSEMKLWFEQRKERFHPLGLRWGDPKLALGLIPVARLKDPIDNLNEVKDFIQFLSEFDEVQKVVLD